MCLRPRSIYGSGYPDTVGARGVAGLNFPFFFWPVVWPGPAIGAGSYLHDSNEVHPHPGSTSTHLIEIHYSMASQITHPDPVGR